MACGGGPSANGSGAEEASAVVHTVRGRVSSRLSERARSAFCAMDVTPVPAQSILFGELAEPSRQTLALMGLEVVSCAGCPAGDSRDTHPG
jgi:hypothetical protein